MGKQDTIAEIKHKIKEQEISRVQVLVVGGGPAGLAAALSAKEAGADSILIVERAGELGGILNQCIHNGFGLHTFKEELTGPEYAARYIDKVKEKEIPYMLNTIVVDIEHTHGPGVKTVTCMNSRNGIFQIHAAAVILAMGCRERPRGALNIPGFRPAGIYSAGTAQRYVNIEGRMPGKEVVILGSGDIGLIMARRMTLEGAKVKAVAELMPYSGGLKRNIVQCLDDYGIPLKLSHTVVDIKGKERVEGVTLAQVDEKLQPIAGTEEFYECDTLLLSCGLIPENELTYGLDAEMSNVTSGPVVYDNLETSVSGVFACGNVLHVHDLVDYVSKEAEKAGRMATEYLIRPVEGVMDDYYIEALAPEVRVIDVKATDGVRYTVPSKIRPGIMEDMLTVRFRVGNVYKDKNVCVYFGDKLITKQKKRVLAPGEMEQVVIRKSDVLDFDELNTITIKLED